MSRQVTKLDPKKVNAELFTLTYGALVTRLLKDYENIDDVNKQLERVGYNIGVRLIEDFLARTNSGRCSDFRETSEKIQSAFRTYFGVLPQVNGWSAAGDEFSLIFDNNPLAEFVELPDHYLQLKYSNILVGIIRGACEMFRSNRAKKKAGCSIKFPPPEHEGLTIVIISPEAPTVHMEVNSSFIQDQLKGDNCTELRVKFIRKLEDAIPTGED